MSYKMTMSVKFCLSYEFLDWDFIAFKIAVISVRKRIVDTDGFYDLTLSTG